MIMKERAYIPLLLLFSISILLIGCTEGSIAGQAGRQQQRVVNYQDCIDNDGNNPYVPSIATLSNYSITGGKARTSYHLDYFSGNKLYEQTCNPRPRAGRSPLETKQANCPQGFATTEFPHPSGSGILGVDSCVCLADADCGGGYVCSDNGVCITEICENGLDDNTNGLVDCGDVDACYRSLQAPRNICTGNNNVDGMKVLLSGRNFGFVGRDVVKSDRFANLPYESGEHACQITFDGSCRRIEKHDAMSGWTTDDTKDCSTPLQGYALTGIYRAVCLPGVKPWGPPEDIPGEDIPMGENNPLEGR